MKQPPPPTISPTTGRTRAADRGRQAWVRWVAAVIAVGLAGAAGGCEPGQAGRSVTPYVTGSSPASPSSSAVSSPTSPTPSRAASTWQPPAPPTTIPTATGAQTPNSPALVAEAEAIMRLYYYEDLKLWINGGGPLPASFAKLLDEPMLSNRTNGYARLKKNGQRRIPTGKAHLVSSKVYTGDDSVDGAVVTLLQCFDSGGDVISGANRKTIVIPNLQSIAYLKRHRDGTLRLAVLDQKEVSQC